MQKNYAAQKKKKFIEHVRYSEVDAMLDRGMSQENALAENFLIYIGVDNVRVKSEDDGYCYLSDILAAFKAFVPPG